MRFCSIFLAVALAAGSPALAAQTKKPAAKKSAPKKKRAARRAAPPKQMQPTPERYREIQQALIDRGFLDGEPTGRWDENSINAWKRLEESENLPVDGKIDAKGLIALGLAPNRQAALGKGENE